MSALLDRSQPAVLAPTSTSEFTQLNCHSQSYTINGIPTDTVITSHTDTIHIIITQNQLIGGCIIECGIDNIESTDRHYTSRQLLGNRSGTVNESMLARQLIQYIADHQFHQTSIILMCSLKKSKSTPSDLVDNSLIKTLFTLITQSNIIQQCIQQPQ